MPGKKKKKKSKTSRDAEIKELRNRIEQYASQTLRKVDPIEGATFISLTMGIYYFREENTLYNGFKNLLGLPTAMMEAVSGILALGKGMNWQDVQNLAFTPNLIGELGKKEWELREAFYGLGQGVADKIIGSSNMKAGYWRDAIKEVGREPTEAEEQAILDNTVKEMAWKAKAYRLLEAMAMSGAIILFLKSYNWFQAVENVPNVQVFGSGIGQ